MSQTAIESGYVWTFDSMRIFPDQLGEPPRKSRICRPLFHVASTTLRLWFIDTVKRTSTQIAETQFSDSSGNPFTAKGRVKEAIEAHKKAYMASNPEIQMLPP